ncbi:type III pantothenate kinase [Cnuella takakiae]|uniref:Type III pantothenate kinase n=1 Tax=Cnuella takakiae TaxID=1302690 RepID=A0A1M5GYA8_9BACT|nr:type III pantothenate kinase [Cnuella takakiae]OLY90845.1 type III pantothenate kinase [Cnuella takakiae]SHG08683.1 type III pantothenate kinase [Cnuella takakiae]
MNLTLCFDFGNTRWKAALFAGREIQETFLFDEDLVLQQVSAVLQQYQPAAAILSSVVNHPPELESLLAGHTDFHRLSHLTRLPFTIPVGKPETVGADRLALSAAAVWLHPDSHNLAIGLGSCITFNFIDKDHQLLGGSISPGLEMRLRAMHQFTAKLPLVQATWNVPLVGYDTATNLQSGAVLGMAKEIDGIIDAYQERYRNFNVLLTGGDIPYLAPHLKNRIFADPHLIFKGLYAISEVNRSR